MRHRSKTLIRGNHYSLFKKTHPKTKVPTYYLELTLWKFVSFDSETRNEIENHFDPKENRKVPNEVACWRFNTRAEAEQLLLSALLKWSQLSE